MVPLSPPLCPTLARSSESSNLPCAASLARTSSPAADEPTNTSPDPRPQIAAQEARLGRVIDRLEKAVETFINRVAPVLRESGKDLTDAAVMTAPPLVPLAQCLSNHTDHIEAIVDRLESAAGRVEL